jgi:hypothetical protein
VDYIVGLEKPSSRVILRKLDKQRENKACNGGSPYIPELFGHYWQHEAKRQEHYEISAYLPRPVGIISALQHSAQLPHWSENMAAHSRRPVDKSYAEDAVQIKRQSEKAHSLDDKLAAAEPLYSVF